MRGRLRTLAIQVLFRLLDIKSEPNEHIDKWLAGAWEHPGFKAYVAARDAQLIKGLIGQSLDVPPRDKAHHFAGQRFELLRIAHQSKMAYEKRKKEIAKQAAQ